MGLLSFDWPALIIKIKFIWLSNRIWQFLIVSSFLLQEYLIIGHTADQTHVTNDKHAQGMFAMDFVDSDRVHLARESGYAKVTLTKMRPENCTPKNNMIVAAFLE